jgi:hypothetical protein
MSYQRGQRNTKFVRNIEICRMRANGKTLKEIAVTFSISQPNVRRICQFPERYGFTTSTELIQTTNRLLATIERLGMEQLQKFVDQSITKDQVAITLGKVWSGYKPGDELWGDLDDQALEYALRGSSGDKR